MALSPPVKVASGLGLFGAGILVGVLGMLGSGDAAAPSQESALPGDDQVLARVEDTRITRYDLNQGVKAALGDYAKGRLGAAARKDVLDSLVATRAMALKQEKALSPAQKAALDKKVQAYREQQLVRLYLKENTDMKPVTDKMIRAHYEKNPERYGKRTVRTYDLLATERELSSQERVLLMKAVKGKQRADFEAWAAELKKQGLPVRVQRGSTDHKMLHPKLQRLVKGLKDGEQSPLSFVEGRGYIAKITGGREQGPRPLSEVRDDIERVLKPIQTKAAVKQATGGLLSQVQVEYVR